MSLIQLESVTKVYQTEEHAITAVKDLSLEIREASFVSFVGPSGSGKSTLLNLLGCLDQPTTGTVSISGTVVNRLNRIERAKFRGENIGFVFQNFNLLPVLTVFENVEYPLFMVQDVPKEERSKRVLALLDKVGMLDQKNKFPNQLSGGQKQRVAVARALVTSPKIVLADEPTANLDSASAFQVIKVLHKMRDEFGTTFIFATHDPRIVQEAEVIYTLEDGALKERQVTEKGQG
ncbi:MAG: ABC transporter [Bdellovibrionales bacterium RIFOXYD1_FULL_53_11]|nr:MAG: ABC transporter [Bdellovibrionales bacterium RIFOXYD1_FULL_53_11]